MLSMYSKLYCIIWYFACLHKYPKWIVLSSYAMISIELCILCSIGNRFGSVRLVLGGCQWPALGRNLHNFIWIVALINCPRFPLSSILSLSVSVLLFYRLHIVMTFKTFVLFLYVPVFLPPLLLYRSPSLPLLVPMLSPAFDFSLIKLSASGYGFLSHYGSVFPPFFSIFFPLSQCFSSFCFLYRFVVWLTQRFLYRPHHGKKEVSSYLLESTFICCSAFVMA